MSAPPDSRPARPPRVLLGALFGLLGHWAAPAAATSFVPMSDEALVDRAPLAAVVEVEASVAAPAGERPETEHRVRVLRWLKGTGPPAIRVRVPGGAGHGGLGLRIWGAPRLRPGGRAILLLSPRADGAYSVFHLLLGAFHETSSGAARLAERDLAGARPIAFRGQPLPAEPRRDFESFADWIAGRAAGDRPRPAYLLPEDPAARRLAAPFRLFADADDGHALRWFEFEGGGAATWFAHEDGQPGLTGGGFAELAAAIGAWNDDPGTIIAYGYGGTTPDPGGGLEFFDGVNLIRFASDLGSPFSCTDGGVLAIGGPWYFLETTDHRGTLFHAIAGADVETNEGIECFFSDSPDAGRAAEELFGHELGHTLGIDHSCGGGAGSCADPLLDESLMRSFVHDDGRGARLNADDRAGIAALYAPPPPPPPPSPPPGSFYTLTPCRLLDTRVPAGAWGGPALRPGERRGFVAGGRCSVPATAAAIVVNVTAVAPLSSGHLNLYAAGLPTPDTTTVSFSFATRANNAIVALAPPDGAFVVEAFLPVSLSWVDVVVDVSGYFE